MASNNIKTNERELSNKVTEWLNEIIKRNNYPFSSASSETGIAAGNSTMFGDIIIWKDRETKHAFSYLELKPPGGAKENLETFRQKAVELGVKYALTWDFQNLFVYKVEKNNILFTDSETENILDKTDDWLRGDYQAKIKAYLQKILDEIESLNDIGKLRKFYPDKIYFVNFIRKAVQDLVPKFEKFLMEAGRNYSNKQLIAEYASKQGIAFPSESEYYKLIANQTVYALVTKIIFYLTIRRYFDDLPDIYKTDEPDLNKLLKYAFAKAREKDWQAVFVEDPIEVLGLPANIYDEIRLFISELKVYHFGELSEDVIGELFEEIIDPKSRHQLGQYFTNEDLVDLVIGFAVQDKNGYYGDPTCGSGTFLIRLYDRLRYLSSYKMHHKELLEKIWGIDIGKFPAELSTINLFRQDISNYENFPRVIRTDIFDVVKGTEFDFPPPDSGKNFYKIKKTLPEFTGFVGNFPFIRQELIEKKDKGYKKKLTKVLAKEYFLNMPSLFNTKSLTIGLIEELRNKDRKEYERDIEHYVDNKNIDLKLSSKADIYAYIYLHTATLLSENGTFAIITSNSWLDVSYGSILKEFFLNNFHIKAIIASWAEPWFDDAAVNTVITVLQKKEPNEKPLAMVKFVKLKKKLEELIPTRDLKLYSARRWREIDRIVDTIETADFHPNLRSVTPDLSVVEIDNMSIRLINHDFLQKELSEKKEFAKWGKYLRAPDVYFDILEKCKGKLKRLNDIADVIRGYTTGINDFFYLTIINKQSKNPNSLVCRNACGWEGEIEEEFLKSIIKSPKETKSILVQPSELTYKMFNCNINVAELKRSGKLGAVKYIEWGSKQRTKDNIFWKDVPSVANKKNWYSLSDTEIAHLFAPKGINDRYFFLISKSGSLSNNRLYNIYPKNDIRYDDIAFVLNSTLEYLFLEIESRVNLGDGLIDNGKDAIENLFFLDILPIKTKYDLSKLINRPIGSIFKEVKQKDRQDFDTTILKYLNLNPDEYLPRIYDGLTQLVKERLELPKMRKKKKTQTTKSAYDQIKKAVIYEILPEGVKKFPHAFYIGDYDSLELITYNANGRPLISESFFNQFELKDETGTTVIVTDSEAKADLIEQITKKEVYILKIPAEDKVIESILSSYKRYVQNITKSLENSAHQKLHDWSLAEKMATEILSEFGYY